MIGVVARSYPSSPVPARFRPRNDITTPHQGAAQGRRARGWYAPSSGPNDAVVGSLTTLRQRARAALRNDGYARSAIARLATNIVGSGIKPLSKLPDPLRTVVQALWLQWTDESDADGLLDFYGQQAQAVDTWLGAGEAFVRLRPRLPSDGLSVPLQLQILEPELCPHDYTTTAPNGNRIVMGVELSAIGRRLAYWFYRAHPGDSLTGAVGEIGRLVRVPAESIVHLYDPFRPGQLRGIPKLAPALVKLRDLDEFDDATLLRQKLANLFMGFTKRPAGGGAEPAIDSVTGRAVETDAEGRPLVGFEPGTWWELQPGEEVDFSRPPSVEQGYADFMRQQLMAVAVAVDVPYEILTGDLSKVNDRTARMILNEFRRRIEQWQYHIVCHQLNRPVWQAWWDRAVISGALEVPVAYFATPAVYTAAEWTPQRWAYLNPVQDVQARRDEIRAGLTSRRQAVSELGGDVEALDAEIAADNDRADRLGLVLDSDPRKVAQTGTAQKTEPVPVEAA